MGSNTVAPDHPVTGLIRFNQTTGTPEVYANDEWNSFSVGVGGARVASKDTYYGDGTTRRFGPMKYSYRAGNEIMLLVFVGNVFQNPGIAYTVDGFEINFTSTPPAGQYIVVLHGFAG